MLISSTSYILSLILYEKYLSFLHMSRTAYRAGLCISPRGVSRCVFGILTVLIIFLKFLDIAGCYCCF